MANVPNERPGRRIRSVEIAFTILKTIRKRDRITVTELANELGHSKSTVHSHLRTLEDQEIIVREGNGYRLGLQILDMANDVREQACNYNVIVEKVDELANETGEIAQFGLEEHGQLAYLYKARGEHAVETASRIGQKQPIYSTSLGKAILAHLPSDRTEEIVSTAEFTPRGPNTITNERELYENLETIAERGYAIDDEENIEGLRCVAAPIKNDEIIHGAISVTGPASRITDERLHGEIAESVQRAANVIELNTKFS
ncbi:IclR family transcriptional regulator [Natrinema versiforme]|uniref:IclR family transcriptional regulator n=1 Tax=Natrinema versiforme TaxID=88724 RepID=A0A4P8WMX1_9EURY|nr:IclR family transcriptional regulator [Natrinema versiforme]QCS44957.1 IclR family transcriptional regulator [Natrinema versiforme]